MSNFVREQWARLLVECQIDMKEIESRARSGNPVDILAHARRLQQDASALAAWVELDIIESNTKGRALR